MPYPAYNVMLGLDGISGGWDFALWDTSLWGEGTPPLTDITADWRSSTPVRFFRGLDIIQPAIPARAGSLVLNIDNVAGTYNPSTGVAIKGQPVQIKATYDAVEYPMWYGLIDQPKQHPELGNKSVDLPCLGVFSSVISQGTGTHKVSTALYSSIRTDEAITVILNAIGWPTSLRDLDQGKTTLQWWWVEEQDPWTAMQALLAAEGPTAALYEDAEGRICFRNRWALSTLTRCNTAQAVFTDLAPAERATRNIVKYPGLVAGPGTGWTNFGGSATVTFPARSGTVDGYAAKVDVTAAFNGMASTGTNVFENVTELTEYTLSVYVEAPLGQYFALRWNDFDAGGVYITAHSSGHYGTGTRTRYTITGTTAALTTQIMVYIYTLAGAVATLYVDGFQMELGATATTYCDGAQGVGYAWVGTANASASTRVSSLVQIARPFDYDNGQKYVVNTATWIVVTRTAKAAAVVWTGPATITLAPDEVAVYRPSTSGDPFMNATCVAGVDYTVTAGSASVTLDRDSGQSAPLTITAGAAGATITGLQVQAELVSVDSTTDVSNTVNSPLAANTLPVQLNVPRTTEISESVAQSLCNSYVGLWSSGRPIITVTLINVSEEVLLQQLSRETLDRVTIVEEGIALEEDFIIVGINHEISSGGAVLKTTFQCLLASTNFGAWDYATWDSGVWGF